MSGQQTVKERGYSGSEENIRKGSEAGEFRAPSRRSCSVVMTGTQGVCTGIHAQRGSWGDIALLRGCGSILRMHTCTTFTVLCLHHNFA